MVDLAECSHEELLAEIAKRCTRDDREDPLGADELTAAMWEHLDYNSRDLLMAMRERSDWSDEDLLGSGRYEELTRYAGIELVLLPIVQQLARPCRPSDYAHALQEAERVLLQFGLFHTYESGAKLL